MTKADPNIPALAALPVLGHLHRIPDGKFQHYLLETSRSFPDGIFRVQFGSYPALFVFDPDLVAELSDETRFRKLPVGPVKGLRPLAGDALFTAYSDEPNWGKAHRILMPAFSQRAMRGYFDMILGVTEQLVDKWAQRPGRDLLVSDDMTRLTLESIALAGFGQRFGSFERDELAPFLQAMSVALEHVNRDLTRLPLRKRFAPRREAREFAASARVMNTLVDELIASRRAAPDPEARDLLNLMLTAIDPETGEGLDNLNIRRQVLTFLIAGHETTSGLLTFALYLLMRNPHTLARAYAEVDRILPDDTRLEYRHLAMLDVVSRVLDEALRLWPTAPVFTVAAFKAETIGGRYRLSKNRPVNIVAPALHRNPKAWENPDDFDIDRWLPGRAEARHSHAYKPFGNGERACIGRQFALLEAKIALSVVLQRFDLSDPHDYRLEIKETLTIKPDGFFVRARRRRQTERLMIAPTAWTDPDTTDVGSVAGAGQTLTVLYGTSLGTSQDVAGQIAERAAKDGFRVVTRTLDEAFDAPPETGVLVVVTATYNGRAPDTAVRLEAAIAQGKLAGIRWPAKRFAVLGIGNSQWPNFQAFPKLVDATLAATGAQRLVPRGVADGNGDFERGVDAFIASLWTSLSATLGAADDGDFALTMVDRSAERLSVLPGQPTMFEVVANRELVLPATDGLWDFAEEAPRGSTRAIRLRLPDAIDYETGDYVAIYARNRRDVTDAAIARLGVDGDALVRLDGSSSRFRHLPLGRTLRVRELLEDYVDLQETASRRAVERLARVTACPPSRVELERLSREAYQAEIADRRVTLLDLLIRDPAIETTLETFVGLSAAIQPRFYSIASSPRALAGAVDLLVGTIAAPAWSGRGQHEGLASTYLRDLAPGDTVLGFVRRPNPPFAPPADPAVPMILVGPGTGLAPFRGFLQDRAARRDAGEAVGATHLFFGCRHPDHDWLHRGEMEGWAADGVADLHLAFSAAPEHPWRFVQDAIWARQDVVWAAITSGAVIYVCGDGRHMAPAVRDTLIRIHMQQAGTTHAQSSDWLKAMIDNGRYHQDVFGFGK